MSLLPQPLQPLKRKLPFLITTLLCVVVGTILWIVQRQVGRAFENASSRELHGAAQQIAALLEQSGTAMRRQVRVTANDPAVVAFLRGTSGGGAAGVRRLLSTHANPGAGTPVPARTLWRRECSVAMHVPWRLPDSAPLTCPGADEVTRNAGRTAWLRPFTVHGGSVQFEQVSPVVDGTDTLGFLAERHAMVRGSQQGMRALKALVGEDSRILVGNAAGGPGWNDLEGTAPAPVLGVVGTPGHSNRPDGVPTLGVALPVANTPWMLWVDLPRAHIEREARQTVGSVAGLAFLCVLAGALGAWRISIRVTRPLGELSRAANELARGDYSRRVHVAAGDEIGVLQQSFNDMATEVEGGRRHLKARSEELELRYEEAQDLTRELEASNLELMESNEATTLARRERSRAESLLDEVLARAPVGIAVLDTDLRYIRVNPALAAFNRASVRAHHGRRPSEVVPALAEVEAEMRGVLESGAVIGGRRSSAALHGGARSHWLSSLFPVRDADGTIAGVGVIIVDTTAHHDLEAQLLQAQKMDAVGRLAGGVAHDFNNLLTVISSYSALAIEELPAGDPLHEDMCEVLSAAERAAGLTRQLLAFSRNQVLQPDVIDLNEVASDMERMLTRLIGEDVALTLDLSPGIGRVSADRGQIEQVLMNLVINARDAMPDGGQLIIATDSDTITAEYSIAEIGVPAGDYVMLTVSDNGTGMSPETLSHLFEPFFTTKPVGRGTGLGLATVYGIVRQSGGDIRVRSEPGAGSSFTICLPRARPDATPAARRAGGGAADHGGTETVLLVEDDAALRHLARRVLRGAGYTVLEASDAQMALDAVAEYSGELHLLLTDVVMPGMNGRALGERLASSHPRLRVLYMSGYTDDEVMRRGIRAAQTAFLQKPFTPADLTRSVRVALDSAPFAGERRGLDPAS